MLFNQEDKIIFICVPKTASTAIKKYVLSHSQLYVSNEIIFDKRKINLTTHTKVKQIKNILKDNFSDYKIYFVYREPFDCMESKYKFYNYGRAKKRLFSLHPEILKFSKIIRMVFSLVMPYSLWCLIYPLNINLKYVTINDKLTENLIGIDFNEFKKNPSILLKKLDKNLNPTTIDYVNKTGGNKKLVLPKYIKFFVKMKLSKEINFYNKLNN